MQATAAELEAFIESHVPALRALPEKGMSFKPLPAKWSRKEIIGHLIDSAETNIRRFVVAQYEDRPLIVYNQDRWVAIANYQQWETADLVNLWYLLNKQAVEIIKNTKPEMARRQCLAGEPQTIEWLAADYIKHLRHHIHQVLDLDAVAYP